MTTALKFLARGARSPVTGDPWPADAWVERENGARGVRVLAPDQLAWWIADELWVVEVQPPLESDTDSQRAARARLVRRVEAWDVGARRAFVGDCRARAHVVERRGPQGIAGGLVAFLARVAPEDAATAGYAAATLAAARSAEPAEQRQLFVEERSAQSRWLTAALGLSRP